MERKYKNAARKHTAGHFNKAVFKMVEKKKRDHEARKKAAPTRKTTASTKQRSTTPPMAEFEPVEEYEEVQVSDDDMADAVDEQPATKRKRDSESPATPAESEGGTKKLKVALAAQPPPPPPPRNGFDDDDDGSATPRDELPQQEPSPAETNGSDHKDFARVSVVNGHQSPVQLATPLTNGSTNGHGAGH